MELQVSVCRHCKTFTILPKYKVEGHVVFRMSGSVTLHLSLVMGFPLPYKVKLWFEYCFIRRIVSQIVLLDFIKYGCHKHNRHQLIVLSRTSHSYRTKKNTFLYNKGYILRHFM